MSKHDVGTLLVAIDFRNYRETFFNNEVNGQCLMVCKTVEDLIAFGILLKPKAIVLLKLIDQWIKTGVPKKYLSDNEDTHQDDR